MAMSDEELLLMVRKGKDSAFEKLIKRYQNPVHNFLFRMVKHPEDSADLVQQVFFQVYKKSAQFKEGTYFKAWLFAIASNTGKNHYQAKIRQWKKATINTGFSASDPESGLNNLIRKQNIKRLLDAMQQLPPKQKLTIELRIYRDYTIDEIANIMDVSSGATKANLHHGLKKLKQMFELDNAIP